MKIPLYKFVRLLENDLMVKILEDRESMNKFLDQWKFDNHFATLIK